MCAVKVDRILRGLEKKICSGWQTNFFFRGLESVGLGIVNAGRVNAGVWNAGKVDDSEWPAEVNGVLYLGNWKNYLETIG